MSCDTLNQEPVSLNVSIGALPEGFCPQNMQQLADVIAARLIITPNQSNSTFVVGSTAPSSNIGPWLKNCLEWYVFDDTTATYIPITKGGFNAQTYYTASNTFVVPDGIYKLRIHAWGGGGGGGNTDGTGGWNSSGGGGGAYGMAIVSVTPSQSIAFTIGSGGSNADPGNAGGTTTVLGMTATGGGGGTKGGGLNPSGGAGGTATGFDVNISGGSGQAAISDAGSIGGSGGDAGGWGGSGGSFGTSAGNGLPGVLPGGGGGGHVYTVGTGGSGAGGAILVEY